MYILEEIFIYFEVAGGWSRVGNFSGVQFIPGMILFSTSLSEYTRDVFGYHHHKDVYILQRASLRGRPTPPATLAQEKETYIKLLCEVESDRSP